MSDHLVHRGPDDEGVWCDPDAGYGIAHRRLAVVELSGAGTQPMHTRSGRYVLAYNGEIYNHAELRARLEHGGATVWRGSSDTETLLACIEAWGVERTIRQAVGMFAIALWDRSARVLTLVRDRLGEKPLYYGWHGSGSQRIFFFGSELKALEIHPSFKGEIDRGALCMLLRFNCIPAPWSVYRNIYKLAPASILTVSPTDQEPDVRTYWSALEVAHSARANSFAGTPEEAVDELQSRITEVVRGQMIADVPLGAFLSGGIDSSTIVATMQAQSAKPVRTFSIGFDDRTYDEAAHAKLVARHLGTDHTELYVSSRQALDVIPRLPTLYCEPFADSSQIPTFLVSQLARSSVTVSLSGDGGDELFSGYNRYKLTAMLWRRLSVVPACIRRAAAGMLLRASPATWDRWARLLPLARDFTAIGDKVHKGATVLASRSVDELYNGLVSHHGNPETYLRSAHEHPSRLDWHAPDLRGFDVIEKMMIIDTVTYLPDDILVKIDRAAMGTSLETRIPFLDHRMFEFAWRLPLNFKLRRGVTKWPLRQLLYRHVPPELVDKPKAGFAIPLHDWLRGPLRHWAEALLDVNRLKSEGYFEPEAVRHIWTEHLSRRKNLAYHIWDVLMFQAWLADRQI
jgi:asparagine synthase (glutamine-hydrolysing)